MKTIQLKMTFFCFLIFTFENQQWTKAERIRKKLKSHVLCYKKKNGLKKELLSLVRQPNEKNQRKIVLLGQSSKLEWGIHFLFFYHQFHTLSTESP